jgi:hypothetical protein
VFATVAMMKDFKLNVYEQTVTRPCQVFSQVFPPGRMKTDNKDWRNKI